MDGCLPAFFCSCLAVTCPQCSYRQAYFMQIQIHSADEPMINRPNMLFQTLCSSELVPVAAFDPKRDFPSLNSVGCILYETELRD